MVGVLWHHESAARGYYTRAPRSAQNLIHRARENTHMHDFSCSGAESVVSLSYFSPAQPAGPTIIIIRTGNLRSELTDTHTKHSLGLILLFFL